MESEPVKDMQEMNNVTCTTQQPCVTEPCTEKAPEVEQGDKDDSSDEQQEGVTSPIISSKYRGVCWSRQRKMWRARIKVKGKLEHLGYFDDEELAARVYDKRSFAVNKHNGIFNFPEEIEKIPVEPAKAPKRRVKVKQPKVPGEPPLTRERAFVSLRASKYRKISSSLSNDGNENNESQLKTTSSMSSLTSNSNTSTTSPKISDLSKAIMERIHVPHHAVFTQSSKGAITSHNITNSSVSLSSNDFNLQSNGNLSEGGNISGVNKNQSILNRGNEVLLSSALDAIQTLKSRNANMFRVEKNATGTQTLLTPLQQQQQQQQLPLGMHVAYPTWTHIASLPMLQQQQQQQQQQQFPQLFVTNQMQMAFSSYLPHLMNQLIVPQNGQMHVNSVQYAPSLGKSEHENKQQHQQESEQQTPRVESIGNSNNNAVSPTFSDPSSNKPWTSSKANTDINPTKLELVGGEGEVRNVA